MKTNCCATLLSFCLLTFLAQAVVFDAVAQGLRTTSRVVVAKARNDPILTKALAANGQIDTVGNNLTVDSFDSEYDGPYSPEIARSNGDVATNSTLTNSLNIGNSKIKGKASTGPKGTVYTGPQGEVSGGITDDMNVYFPPVEAPYTTGVLAPLPGEVDGVLYDYVLGDGDYLIDYPMTLSGTVIVTGNATLVVRSEIAFNSSNPSKTGNLIIQTNASLRLYADCESVRLGGNGVANQGGLAENFYLYGTPANKTIEVKGNASLIGVIYAPNSAFTLKGGGQNATYDLTGAAVVGTAMLTGVFQFHYDEKLARVGPSRGFIVTEWDEF